MFLNSLIKVTGSTENCGAIYRALRAVRSAVDRFMDISFTTPASYLFKDIRTFENVKLYANTQAPWMMTILIVSGRVSRNRF